MARGRMFPAPPQGPDEIPVPPRDYADLYVPAEPAVSGAVVAEVPEAEVRAPWWRRAWLQLKALFSGR